MKSEVLWPGKAVSSSNIFIYGSLLEGCCNHHVIASAKMLFAARTKPEYDLIDLGEYPALVSGGTTSVRGSVYEVEPDLLAILDEFEDHPDMYRRTQIELFEGHLVQTYLFPRRLLWAQTPVDSGDWRTYVLARQN